MEKTEILIPRSQDVDLNSRLRINELMNYLADFARRHADEQNFGFYSMADNGLYWVLHSMKLEIHRLPLLDEPLTSTTRAWFQRGLRAQRQFSLSTHTTQTKGTQAAKNPETGSGSGMKRDLIRAHSLWLLIDGERKRPVPIHSQFEPQGEPMFDAGELSAIEGVPNPDKLGPEMADPENLSADAQFNRTVAYSDVDVHQHMNNSRYVALALDSLPMETWESTRPMSVEVSFLKECFLGDEITVKRFTNARGHLVQCLRDSQPVFTMKLVHRSL